MYIPDNYGISRERYRELLNFCLQYNDWRRQTGRNHTMRKRVLTNTDHRQFAIIPTIGIIKPVDAYRFRFVFMWGVWQLSVGCFRD